MTDGFVANGFSDRPETLPTFLALKGRESLVYNAELQNGQNSKEKVLHGLMSRNEQFEV